MIVVDSSALVAFIAGVPANPLLDERLWAEDELHAPHVIDLEVLSTLRSFVARGALSSDRASDFVADLGSLRILRHRHDTFRERIWALRANVTPHDAAFIALAETLEAPLVTTDARLARAPGHDARVEVYD